MQCKSWNNPEYVIETKYVVEYLAASSENGAQRWKLYQHAQERGSSFNPWELVDKREFDDLSAAYEFYLARLLDEQTFVVHPIFEQIEVNGTLARESTIEENPTFLWNLRGWIDREMRGELDKLRKEEKSSAELLADYAEFFKLLDGNTGKFAEDFRKFHYQKEDERNG